MVNSQAKTVVFSLTTKRPRIHVIPRMGRSMKDAFSRDLFGTEHNNLPAYIEDHIQNDLVLSSFLVASLSVILFHLIQSSKDQYQKHSIHLRC